MILEVTDTSANHVHIVGIGGKGMSAIAAALLDLGKTISGSDLEISPQAARLRRRGVRIDEGHNAAMEARLEDVRRASLEGYGVWHPRFAALPGAVVDGASWRRAGGPLESCERSALVDGP